jgi:transposase
MLTKIAGRNAIKMRQIYNLYHQFRDEGRTSCQDEPRSGRPCVATDEEHQHSLEELLEEQRSWTTEDLASRLGTSKYSVQQLLKKLNVRKVSSRWVPYSLTDEQKELRVNLSIEHLERYHHNPEFIDKIIAIDETWIKSYDHKDASQSKECRYSGEEPYV